MGGARLKRRRRSSRAKKKTAGCAEEGKLRRRLSRAVFELVTLSLSLSLLKTAPANWLMTENALSRVGLESFRARVSPCFTGLVFIIRYHSCLRLPQSE